MYTCEPDCLTLATVQCKDNPLPIVWSGSLCSNTFRICCWIQEVGHSKVNKSLSEFHCSFLLGTTLSMTLRVGCWGIGQWLYRTWLTLFWTMSSVRTLRRYMYMYNHSCTHDKPMFTCTGVGTGSWVTMYVFSTAMWRDSRDIQQDRKWVMEVHLYRG